MDLDSNTIIAVGTLALAFISFLSILLTRSQLRVLQNQTKFLQDQTVLSISKELPKLVYDNFYFEQNKLNIRLKNLGNSPAFEVGFSTKHFAVDMIGEIKEQQQMYEFWYPHMPKDAVKDLFKQSLKQNLVISDINPQNVVNNTIKFEFRPIEGINYFNKKYGEVVLFSNEDWISLTSEPRFGLDNDIKNVIKYRHLVKKDTTALEDYKPKIYNFDEISKIYQENGVRYVFLQFSLYCKDLLENAIFQNDIATCIIDLSDGEFIEDALLKPRSLIRYKKSFPDVIKDGYYAKWMYEITKWRTVDLTEVNKEDVNIQKKRATFRLPLK